MRPEALSVCVIQFTSRAHLVRCLESLAAQHEHVDEVIVPHDDGFEDPEGLRRAFPHFRILRVAGGRTPAELRAAATHASGGAVIAFLEDHCVPAPDWALRLRAAHGAGHAAVGGAVDKGFVPGRTDDSALNWAVYFTDYSRYMNPQPGGPAPALTDCNVSYRREALLAIAGEWEEEFHENVVNGLLHERGMTLWLDPEVVVHEQRTLTLAGALRDRFAFGRLFASTRVEGAPAGRRVVFAAGSLLMPPVLVARVARTLSARRRHRLQFLRSLLPLVLVSSVWMLGECVGYLTGTAASSLRPADAEGTGGLTHATPGGGRS